MRSNNNWVRIGAIGGLLLFLPALAVQAESAAPTVVLNGTVMEWGLAPFAENGKLYVPVRGAFAAFGYEVWWNAQAQTIEAEKEGIHWSLKPGDASVKRDGEEIGLDAPVRIVDGTAFVPFGEIAQALGYETERNSRENVWYLKPTLRQYIESALRSGDGSLTYAGDSRFGQKQGQGKLFLDGELMYEGHFDNNKMNGAGTLYRNGRPVYQGTFVDNRAEGAGICYFSNGDRYVGEFRDALPNGQGKLYRNDILVYEGGWSEGRMNGSGKLYDGKGNVVFEGEFRSGKRSGFGVLFGESGKKLYDGNWENDKRSGTGRAFSATTGKIEYEGEWTDDRKNGRGTEYWLGDVSSYSLDGNKVTEQTTVQTLYMHEVRFIGGERVQEDRLLSYQGELNDEGLPHGEGKLSLVTGKKVTEAGIINYTNTLYEGKFRFGKKDGFGRQYDNSGKTLVYEGYWKDGVRQGQGISFRLGRIAYEGEWADDRENGTGRVYEYPEDANKTIDGERGTALLYEGTYRDGKLVESLRTYKYYGPFVGGKPNGYGTLVLLYDPQNGPRPSLPLDKDSYGYVVYEGEFKDGLRHGKGKAYENNYLAYEGEFRNNVREGTGKWYFYNKVYEGEFKGGVRHGKGKLYNEYRTLIYDGEYVNDMRQGYGKEYSFYGKLIYEGEFNNDKRNGFGTLYDSDGNVLYKGEFRADETLTDWLKLYNQGG